MPETGQCSDLLCVNHICHISWKSYVSFMNHCSGWHLWMLEKPSSLTCSACHGFIQPQLSHGFLSYLTANHKLNQLLFPGPGSDGKVFNSMNKSIFQLLMQHWLWFQLSNRTGSLVCRSAMNSFSCWWKLFKVCSL